MLIGGRKMGESELNYVDFEMKLKKAYTRDRVLYESVKRILDIVFSVIGLIIILPTIIIFGILIMHETPGPIIYKQKRIGIYGSVFNIYKLRSMYFAEEPEKLKWTEKDDPRVTKIGRFIRRTRIDEFPQIFNIIKGEMSIIGPRPERPELTYKFECEIPGFINRVCVKPGLTGWAQVNGGYDISPAEKYRYDMIYIKNRNILLDAIIILKTFKVVFTGEGSR